MDFRERYIFDVKKDFVGKGGFARVYKALDKVRQRTVALKFYSGVKSDKYDIISEINRMEDIVHTNLIRYHDATFFEHTNPIGEREFTQVGIMEYANAGDIGAFFREKRDLRTTKEIILGILQGLAYLNSQKIAHRDLKPKNILLHKEKGKYIAKIADFGISKKINAAETDVSSQLLGSVEYMAPEQFAPAIYGHNGKLRTNVDLWSLGIILYEIFTQKLPFGSRTKGITYEQILNNILFKELVVDYRYVPEPYRSIIKKCLVKHASKRVKRAEELIVILLGKGNTGPTKNPSTKPVKKPANNNDAGKTAVFEDFVNPEDTEPVNTTVIEPDKKGNDTDDQWHYEPIYENEPYVDDAVSYNDDDDDNDIIDDTTDVDLDLDMDIDQPVYPLNQVIIKEIEVGKNLFRLANFVESFKVLDKYADMPEFDTEATFYLGFMYYNGKCGGAHDPIKGRNLMNKAKRQNRALVLELMLKYVLHK